MKTAVGFIAFLFILAFLSPSTLAQGFSIINKERVDVLFVVDNSGSMQDHQNTFAKMMPELLKKYQENDVHIGIITTDSNDAPMFRGANFTGSFPDVVDHLVATVRALGTQGSYEESPLAQIIKSFTDSIGANFYSQDKQDRLDIYVVTDEEDQSSQYVNPMDFFNDLIFYKYPKSVTLNLYGPLSDCNISGSLLDSNLSKLSYITGGEKFDFCKL